MKRLRRRESLDFLVRIVRQEDSHPRNCGAEIPLGDPRRASPSTCDCGVASPLREQCLIPVGVYRTARERSITLAANRQSAGPSVTK